jgi:hypothetical protein
MFSASEVIGSSESDRVFRDSIALGGGYGGDEQYAILARIRIRWLVHYYGFSNKRFVTLKACYKIEVDAGNCT